jgi:hypothetical protein
MNSNYTFGGIFFVVAGFAGISAAYQLIFRRRAYWIYPTISRFKDRKEKLTSKGTAIFFGILSLFWGFVALFFAYTCFDG